MDRNKLTPKVSPILDTRNTANKLAGVRSQREQDEAIDRSSRFSGDIRQPIVTISTPFWFRENVGSAGDGTYSSRLPFPDGASSFNSRSVGNIIAPCAGWVVGAFLELSEARTAGTVAGRVLIDDDAFEFEDNLTLSATSPIQSYTSFFAPFSQEFPFAEDSTIRGSFVTAGTFAPITADARIWYILRLDVT